MWHEDAVAAWRRSPHRDRCARVLLELPDGLDREATQAEATALVASIGALAPGQELLLHGEGSSCWPALEVAARRGLATRIGLEDTVALPDGSSAADNAELVACARRVVRTEASGR